MSRYRITNRVSREGREVEAPHAQAACVACGWMIGECHVKLLREGPRDEAQERDQARPADEPRRARIGDMYR